MRDFSKTLSQSKSLQEILWIGALALLCFFVLFNNLGGVALFEPDEGRNAEVAREILLTGDWITPHLNFTPYLDKPAFFFWLVAFSFKLFGLSEWAARLPSASMGISSILIVYGFARRWLGRWAALWGGLVLATNVEFFFLSRIVLFDMTMTFFITYSLCAFYWGTQTDNRRARRIYYLSAAAAMGFATLVKGPIGLLLPGSIMLVYVFLTRRWVVFSPTDMVLGLMVFFLVAAPWYLLVEARNPGYLRYLLGEEYLARFFTPHFRRGGGWYYFFFILAGGFLPWTFLIPPVARNLFGRKVDDKTLFLIIWTVLPFVVFSFSQSKLPAYIVPMFPPLSILTGKQLADALGNPLKGRRWQLATAWMALAFPIAFVLAGSLRPELVPSQLRDSVEPFSAGAPYWLALLAVILVTAMTLLFRSVTVARQAYLYALSCVTFAALFFTLQNLLAPLSSTQSSKDLAEEIARLIGPRDQLVLYDVYPSSLPFYLRINRPIWIVWSGAKESVMGSIYIAEKKLQPAPDFGKVLLTFDEFALAWKNPGQRLVVFMKEKSLGHLDQLGGPPGKRLFQEGEMILVFH